ncbi:MAG: hypothetical protein LQ350_003576 [Teloschistes chrysophthalmus]|nr:MAG: hypothetical protein LQ350_003576 [Niorma chrysophthalma]
MADIANFRTVLSLLLFPFLLPTTTTITTYASPTALPLPPPTEPEPDTPAIILLADLQPTTTNHTSLLQERQVVLLGLAAVSFGIGYITGARRQQARDAESRRAGLNKGAGSMCFGSGSWGGEGTVSVGFSSCFGGGLVGGSCFLGKGEGGDEVLRWETGDLGGKRDLGKQKDRENKEIEGKRTYIRAAMEENGQDVQREMLREFGPGW